MTKLWQCQKVPTIAAGESFWINDNIACIVTYSNAVSRKHITMAMAREMVEARAEQDGISLLEASEAIKREKRKAFTER